MVNVYDKLMYSKTATLDDHKYIELRDLVWLAIRRAIDGIDCKLWFDAANEHFVLDCGYDDAEDSVAREHSIKIWYVNPYSVDDRSDTPENVNKIVGGILYRLGQIRRITETDNKETKKMMEDLEDRFKNACDQIEDLVNYVYDQETTARTMASVARKLYDETLKELKISYDQLISQTIGEEENDNE